MQRGNWEFLPLHSCSSACLLRLSYWKKKKSGRCTHLQNEGTVGRITSPHSCGHGVIFRPCKNSGCYEPGLFFLEPLGHHCLWEAMPCLPLAGLTSSYRAGVPGFCQQLVNCRTALLSVAFDTIWHCWWHQVLSRMRCTQVLQVRPALCFSNSVRNNRMHMWTLPLQEQRLQELKPACYRNLFAPASANAAPLRRTAGLTSFQPCSSVLYLLHAVHILIWIENYWFPYGQSVVLIWRGEFHSANWSSAHLLGDKMVGVPILQMKSWKSD